MQTMRFAIALGLLALALPGCQPSTELRPVLERRPGVLSVGEEPVVTVPAEGAVGVPVAVTVVTWGGATAST